ncbi:MAG: DUF2505 domain-containing protein [Micrococcales bacterium]|nr:DUF2505 domain-containing protein [Micrococcales bacterium]
MRLSAQFDFLAPPDQVAQLLGDAEFVATAMGGAEAAQATVRHSADGAFTVTARGPVQAEDLPQGLKSLAPANLELRQAMVWQPPDANGNRQASLAGEITGAPVALEGQAHLTRSKQGCQLVVEGDVKAAVPLFGRVIEQAGVENVLKALQAQAAQISQWLEANPG